jgi:hypothetical protein
MGRFSPISERSKIGRLSPLTSFASFSEKEGVKRIVGTKEQRKSFVYFDGQKER